MSIYKDDPYRFAEIRVGNGIFIPGYIMRNSNLIEREKMVLTIIAQFDGCTSGNDFFARTLSISESQVSKSIKDLIAKGFVENKGSNRKRELWVSKNIAEKLKHTL